MKGAKHSLFQFPDTGYLGLISADISGNSTITKFKMLIFMTRTKKEEKPVLKFRSFGLVQNSCDLLNQSN